MSGSKTLSDDEKREMLEDIRDVQRANVFMAARLKIQGRKYGRVYRLSV